MTEFQASAEQLHQMGMSTDLSKGTRINCGKCGGKFFTKVFIVTKIPAILNPKIGQDMWAETPLLRCLSCGRTKRIMDIEKKENEK